MNRDAIFAAVFAMASGAPGLNRAERLLKEPHQYEIGDLPVLNFHHGNERPKQLQGGGPVFWKFNPELYLYLLGGDDQADTALCNMLDYLAACFAPPAPGVVKQTLGGLVSEAYLDGEVITGSVEGVSSRIVAIFPLTVILAA